MNWWRVELDASGAILSCEAVEAKTKGTKHVRFVEASSKAEACSFAKAWHEKYKAGLRASHAIRAARCKEAGRCIRCTTTNVAGSPYCVAHRERSAALRRLSDSGQAKARVYLTPAQALAAHRASTAVAAEAGRLRGDLCKIDTPQLIKLLDKLDTEGPYALRAWLVETIERRQAKRAAKEAA